MQRTADDFLADIALRPDDDALRAVFADWLLERADPRGELMALQLKAHRTDADRSREALLVKQYADRWLPAQVLINVDRPSLEFEKGMLAAARIAVRSPQALTESLGHPAWATVRRLRAAPAELIAACPVLERVTEIDEYVVSALAKLQRPLPRLASLGVHSGSSGVLARAFASGVFASVRELGLGFPRWQAMSVPDENEDEARRTVRDLEPRRLAWLFESALGRHLERLVLHTGWLDLATWLPQLASVSKTIREVQLTPTMFEGSSSWHVRFVASEPGVFRSVSLYPGSDLNASFSEGPVREILSTAPRGYFQRAEFPAHLGWASVRRLPCFDHADVH